MSERLATYLNDHLAGARFAIDLLERMRDAHQDESLGHFAADLLAKIEADRAVLQELAEKVGSGTNILKETTAWMAEKASRLKLRLGADEKLGVFESLEALSLGILGKLALWRALATVATIEPHLQGLDLEHMAARAEAQHAEVEQRRLEAARSALTDFPSQVV